jgi:ABC-type transport system involved in multi-copper enzyme maturation permease subunit
MSTETGTHPGHGDGQHALPLRADNQPIHTQPKPPASSLASLVVILAAYVFSLVAPVLVVGPTEKDAPTGRIWLAFTLTAVGVLVAIVTSAIEYVRTKNWSWLIVGIVPALTLLMCGAILAAAKVAP